MDGVGQRMRRLQRRNDALGAAQQLEGREGLVVRGVHVVDATHIPQEGVLRANPGIVQARSDGVHCRRVAVLVL